MQLEDFPKPSKSRKEEGLEYEKGSILIMPQPPVSISPHVKVIFFISSKSRGFSRINYSFHCNPPVVQSIPVKPQWSEQQWFTQFSSLSPQLPVARLLFKWELSSAKTSVNQPTPSTPPPKPTPTHTNPFQTFHLVHNLDLFIPWPSSCSWT